MRLLKLIAVLVPLLFTVGCAKKNAKKNAPTDEPAGVKLQPPAAPPADTNKKGDKEGPNLLNDPRFKTDPNNALPAETPPNGKPSWGFSAPQGGWNAPSPPSVPAAPGAAPAAPAPGAPAPAGKLQTQPVPGPPPAPMPTPAPAFKPVTETDMKEVWIFIENASGASGKMPSQLLIYQALVAAKSPAADLVLGGSIHLTGAKERESVWAFEAKALTSGGLVATQNGVETLTAAELRKRLGK